MNQTAYYGELLPPGIYTAYPDGRITITDEQGERDASAILDRRQGGGRNQADPIARKKRAARWKLRKKLGV
jgi:hypothetical protein